MGIFKKLFNSDVKEECENLQPINNQNVSGNFMMIVDDVFYIAGQWLIATGEVISGEVNVGDEVKINNFTTTKILKIGVFRNKLNHAITGDKIEVLLEGIDKSMINRNDSISK